MDKSAEVVVCGASIMRDVWEIRLREYRQKRQMEEERIRKSALERINQDWQARMSFKIKAPKRLERKAKLPDEPSLDEHKAKKPHLGRPQGFQSSRIQRQVDQVKTPKTTKLALLRRLNESCPGLMVWAKSWKFSQPLPQTEESPCAFDWGQSWKFLNLQPKTDGKPWFDAGFDANNMSSNDEFLSEKISKALSSESFQQDLVTPEWEKSWQFTQKRKESHEGVKNWKSLNKLYEIWGESASDWYESFKSTKPVKEGNIEPDLTQPTMNEEKQPELTWNNSWMYYKKPLHVKSESKHLAWGESWRVAKIISEQETKSIQCHAAVPEELRPSICDVIINVSREMKHTIQFGGRDAPPPEWQKSWTTIKNLSAYKEEINTAECRKEEVKVETLKADKCNASERVKFNVLALPKSKRQQEMLHFSKEMDWKDSWKMLKRQRREERVLRNQRRPQLAPAPQTLTEWANSWRFTNLTLNQDGGLWQQGWSTNTQPRPIRRVHENEDFPHNGPAAVRAWSESWRSIRHQHLSERQGAASTQPLRRRAYERSVADWEESWKSPTQDNHDRPSMTEWTDSWRFSSKENLHSDHSWFEKSMEVKGRRELHRVSTWLSRSFDSQTFKERYPSKVWNDSWKVKQKSDGCGVAHLMKKEVQNWDNSWMFSSTGFYQRQGECYVNCQQGSDVRSHVGLQSVQMESSSEWGRSWKMSNPQPPTSWVDAKPKPFDARDLKLWSKHKHINYLPYALAKDVKLKTWSKSWRFMKTDRDLGEGESAVTRKNIDKQKYLNIDKQKPQDKKWSDACKIAKTQPRPKRNVKAQPGKMTDEDGKEMFREWMESWKFSNDLKSHEPAVVCVSLSSWENSWKFLLDPYAPVNGPKTSKSR